MNLSGRSVLVLRPRDQADALAGLLRERGAEPVVVPAIEIQAPENSVDIDAAIRDATTFEWAVFTSVNGVRIVMDRVHELDVPFDPAHIGAIGPGTARALHGSGYGEVWTPPVYTTDALAEELPDARGEVLLVRAEAAGNELDRRLRDRGMRVRRIDAYRTVETNHDANDCAIEALVNSTAFTPPCNAARIASWFVSTVR